jgi:hypothetical protein
MLLIDDLLFAPLAGFKFVMRTLLKPAERETTVTFQTMPA